MGACRDARRAFHREERTVEAFPLLRHAGAMSKMTVQPNGVEVPVGTDDTIIAALNKNGYTYLLGCRRGGCGICKVQVESGEIEHNRPVAESALSAEERAEGICLGCRAVPQGDVTISLCQSALRVTNPLLHPRSA